MRLTLGWLKDWLDTNTPLDALVDGLTACGHEVESVHNPADALAGIHAAFIESVAPHPSSDRLQVCQVRDHETTRQIVCGAPNARPGIFVALATVGATIPSNKLTIALTTIRGVESHGMLCSHEELATGKDGEGIMELDPDVGLGTPIVTCLGLDDPVIDVSITPNRGDAISVYGLARDLAAKGLGTLRSLPAFRLAPAMTQRPDWVSQDGDVVPEGLRSVAWQAFEAIDPEGLAPLWIRRRLEAVGIGTGHVAVDVTNYVAHSLGQPMHAFDWSLLRGGLHVRYAKEKEAFKGLHGKDSELTQASLVIADAEGPVALAGVMGGLRAACGPTTSRVVLESANFTPESIVHSGRHVGWHSDARYRFERGVDPAMAPVALAWAGQLLTEWSGAKAGGLWHSAQPSEPVPSIELLPEHLEAVTGVCMDETDFAPYLEALGCVRDGQHHWQPPSWRSDLRISEDLIEEVVRMKGVAFFPKVRLPVRHRLHGRPVSVVSQRGSVAKRALAGLGWTEVVSWSMTSAVKAEALGGVASAYHLINPISPELAVMRPFVFAGVLEAVVQGRKRGYGSLAYAEVGPCFAEGQEATSVAWVATGETVLRHWQGAPRGFDYFDLKAVAEALLRAWGLEAQALRCRRDALAPWWHPGQSADLWLGDQRIGTIGQLHPKAAQCWGLEHPVWVGEIVLDGLPAAPIRQSARSVFSPYPSVTRDFGFVLPHGVTAEQVESTLREAGGELLTALRCFDYYADPSLGEGWIALAVEVTYQSQDRTLDDRTIDGMHESLVRAVADRLGGHLRLHHEGASHPSASV